MAWRSSGTTNDEMVDNLQRFGVITSDTVEFGFRSVDRKYFVPKDREDIAHTDQPLKEGNVHISAPHIYGSALEALELQPDSALSFLNVGSGTGYLSCIVAEILGQRSLNFGIEIHKDVVEHSQASIQKWKAERADPERKIPEIEVIHGNALHLSEDSGESVVGFDRIYIGAAVDPGNLSKFTSLLRPGGVLVGPVEDELVKVVRIGPVEDVDKTNDSMQTDADSNNFTTQVLSGVRFASLLTLPVMTTVIPSKVWEPNCHQDYPDSFRKSSRALLLCSSSSLVQLPPKQEKRKSKTNLAAMLPPVIWMEILSFTHRNWFEPPKQDAALLRKRLLEEQANAHKAHQARLQAEARCQMLERERDVFRLMARRWQSRLRTVLDQQSGDASAREAAALSAEDADILNLALNGSETFAIFGLETMLRRLHDRDDDDDEEEEGDEDMDAEHRNESMDEEDGVQQRQNGEEGNNIMIDDDDSDDESFASVMEEGAATGMENANSAPTKELVVRPQVRTVSMSESSL